MVFADGTLENFWQRYLTSVGKSLRGAEEFPKEGGGAGATK
jgi:hypothetical protein